MSEEAPGFLSRWSRRKAAARPPEPDLPPPELPPIETLGPGSDFAAFLQKGVTAELQRQALSVAWRSDPVIAGFRGMADYDWDFNAPSYGKLFPGDDVAKLLRAVMSPPLTDPDPAPPISPVPAIDEPGPVSTMAELAVDPIAAPAKLVVVPRRHGSALPACDPAGSSQQES